MEGAIVLTREQLKRVTGGNIGSGGNATECTNDDDCEKRTYTCKDGDIEKKGKCYANPGADKKTCHYVDPCVFS